MGLATGGILPASALQTVPGHLRPAVQALNSTGAVPLTNRLNLAVSLPLRNREALSNLLGQIYNPASANFHHYLTPAEFTERFGPTAADYQALIAFAQARHLEVTATYSNRLLLDLGGTVGEVQKALHVNLLTYVHPSEGRAFFAPDREPSLESSVPILHIEGLDNFARPQPRLQAQRLASRVSLAVSNNAGSGPSGMYMGKDFRAAYVPDSALDGSGQVVGLLQFDGYAASDITYYESAAGWLRTPLENVLLDGFDGAPTGDGGEVEVSLDIEMSLSMATNLARIIVYEAGPYGSWHDILNRMATDDAARQLSCSWYIPGGGADTTADQIFQEMAAQGQSFFSASGDDDADTGLISFPGDTPYISEVGGTTLTTSGPAGKWVAEQVWNRENGIGSGGGISTQYPIPTWQTNISMTANGGSGTMRNTPDVAMIAENVYVRADGMDYYVGGTSCAAPLWAGFAALVNQQAAATGQAPVGFINPALDVIGSGPNYAAAFHDISVGDNTSPSSPSEFYAAAGYDLCTGWGTPAGQTLINALANPEPLAITPLTGFTAIGGVGGPFSMTARVFALTNIGTNTLTWTLSNTSAWLNASATTGSLTPRGSGAVVTVGLNAMASNLVVGTYDATIWWTNRNDGLGQSRAFNLSVIHPPAITQQPTNVAALEGESGVFYVGATGGTPLAYQWQFDGTNLTDGGPISGATTPTLAVTDISNMEAGQYSVWITNYAGSIASSQASLTITPSAPIIVLQPTNQTVYANITVYLAVGVVGSEPYSYQWSFDGTNLIGATNAVLALTKVQIPQSGDYAVQITNSLGFTNSATAVLTVNPPPPCDPLPAGIVAWWRAEDDTTDSIGTNNGSPIGGLAYTNGEVGQAFVFNESTSFISVPASASLDIGSGDGLTIEGWVQPDAYDVGVSGAPIIEWDSSSTDGLQMWSGAALVVNMKDTLGTAHIIESTNGLLNTNVFQHVAVTYDKASGSAYLYYNGSPIATNQFGPIIPQTTYPVNIGRRTGQPIGDGDTYGGLIDEVSLYNRALSAGEIAGIYQAGAEGKCYIPTPPVIASQPTDQTTYLGTTATFTVIGGGTPPLFYQWQFNETNIVGATNANLSLTEVQYSESGDYSVTVANPYGSTNSAAATLTVNPAPPCDPWPAGITAWWRAEDNALDSVGPNNGTPVGGLVYTAGEVGLGFLLDGVSSYVSVPASPSLAVGSGGTGFSIEGWITPEALTMEYGAPIFEWDASSAIGVQFWAGSSLWANLIDTSGNAHAFQSSNGLLKEGTLAHVALTYDPSSGNAIMYCNGSAVATADLGNFVPQTTYAANIGRRTGSVTGSGYNFQGVIDELSLYNRPLAATEIGAIYAAGISGKCFTPTPPTISVQPTNQAVPVGSTTSFSVVASGTPPLAYQWSLNSTNIVNATNASLILTDVEFSQAGSYAVQVTNRYGATNSSAAVLTVYGVPPTITNQPVSQTVGAGTTVQLLVGAGGTQPLAYQWSFNGTNLASGINAGLVLTSVQISQAGDYAVQITNLYGSTTSAVAVLTVNSAPTCDPVPAGIVAWWRAEDNGLDSVGPNNGTPVGNLVYTNGDVGLGFLLDGVSSYVSVPASPSLAVGSGGTGFSIEGWISPEALTMEYGAPIFEWDASSAIGVQFWAGSSLSANLIDTSGNTHAFQSTNGLLKGGTLAHVALTYDPSSGNAIMYCNGSAVTTADLGNFVPQTTYAANIGRRTGSVTGSGYNFQGIIDELSLYNRPLSATEIGAIYAAGISGKCFTPTPPTISVQPTNQTVPAGSMASFSVVASGSSPLAYQWSFNGTNLASGTNAELVLINVQISQSGDYAVQITNLYGSTTSAVAVLTVSSAPTCDPAPSGMVAWWQAEANALDSAGTNNGTPVGSLIYTNGEVGMGFWLNGVSSYVSVPASPSLAVGSGSTGFSIEGWISPGALTIEYGAPIFEWDSSNAIGVQFWTGSPLSANLIDTSGKAHVFQGNSGALTQGTLAHVALTYDPSSGNAVLYCDGNAVATADLGTFVPQTTYAANIGRRTGNVTGSGYNFQGIINGLSLYNRPLSSNEVYAIYAVGRSGKCSLPPHILNQPTSQVVKVGANVAFKVVASGTPQISYQWSFNGTNLLHATNASLTLNNVQWTNAGDYSMQMVNGYGATNSSNAVLTVQIAPFITLQPTNQTVPVAGSATVMALAAGTAPLSYQWLLDGTNVISGATNTILSLSNLQLTNAGSYSLVVTNAFGAVTSSNAVLAIQVLPPWITQPPLTCTNLAGSTAVFTGTAGGSPPLTFQWQKNGLPLSDGGNILGSATTALTVSSVADGDAGQYALVVTNVAGSITSPPALLVVLNPPIITLQPTNQYVIWHSNVVLQAGASGSAPLSWQWSVNGTNLSDGADLFGSQSSRLTISNSLLANSGNYQVLVTNAVGWTTSSVAVVAVGKPPQINRPPASQSAPLGCDITFSVLAGGTAPLAMQWWKDGTWLSGQTNASVTVSHFQAPDLGAYSVVVTNYWGAVTSAPATLSVSYHPPLAVADEIQRFANGGVRVTAAKLLANDVDTNGDSLTIVGVSSPSTDGGVVGLTNSWIYYAPPAGWTNGDSFTYTVSDGHCETDVGTVLVQVIPDNQQPGQFTIGAQVSGTVLLSFTGIAGSRYRIEYTDSLLNPNWQKLVTQPADTFGVCQTTDGTLTNTARYYRAVPVPATPVEHPQ